MTAPGTPTDQLLRDALANARALVLELSRQRAELLAHPDKLPPEQLAQGTAALEAAAAAADRTLAALEQIARDSLPADPPPPP